MTRGAGQSSKSPESMPRLATQKDLRAVRSLPFCYLCGGAFARDAQINRDHVPPSSAFAKADRDPPLKLKTHIECHKRWSVEDKKVGQLIALKRGERPKAPRDEALRFVGAGNMIGVDNLNIDEAVWRWVSGFHAALYGTPLVLSENSWRTLRTPFPRGTISGNTVSLQPMFHQHSMIVDAIKRNRAADNLDVLVANRGNLRYQCVWVEADDHSKWACMFAIDIYDWKDLGGHTPAIPSRGCAGLYVADNRGAPSGAAVDRRSPIAAPNEEPLDPFGR